MCYISWYFTYLFSICLTFFFAHLISKLKLDDITHVNYVNVVQTEVELASDMLCDC